MEVVMKFGNMIKVLCMCGCIQGSCWGMIDSELTSRTKDAINMWSHLVPSGEVKAEIDDLIPQVLERRQKMERLVEILCDRSNSSQFANYAHMVFVMVFPDCCDEERNKLGGMLAGIASFRGSGGGLDAADYLNDYYNGGYDSYPPEYDDFESSKW